ncbi:MAG: hypothetical protein ACI80V_001535 [Rhodothermales bacterium]|jgi:hypothetical protein
MMRSALLLIFLLSVAGCTRATEANLPVAGTIVEKRDDRTERYQVTWSGVSSYDQGACEIRQPCVHLVRTVNADNRVEVAVTLVEFSQQFRKLN